MLFEKKTVVLNYVLVQIQIIVLILPKKMILQIALST